VASPVPEKGPEKGPDDVVETFRPTSGRIMGVLAIAFVVTLLVTAAWPGDQGIASYVVWGVLFAGTLAWAAMLRPRLWATASDLVLRNMVTTTYVPLAAIDDVVVRQVLAVRAGDSRYVSPVVGRKLRDLGPLKDKDGTTPATMPYPLFVADRIHHLCERARAQEGIEMMSDEQLARAADVRREWAYPEILAILVTGLGFVASVLLAIF
jgi:hypothetical protein